MTRAGLNSLYLLLFGSIVFIFLGVALESASEYKMEDFGVTYYPAKCLIQHCDPYMETEVWRVIRADDNYRPSNTTNALRFAAPYVYPPTAFSFTVPFAMLPWGPAHVLWLTLTIGGLIIASFLIWNLAADSAPIVSGVLIGFFLASSEVIVILCNPAGIAISLCVVAVWCFFRERFITVGILCLAVSLALKPQDTGLVWLYFLLAGGVYRKRALQTLIVAIVLSLPAVLWVWYVAPHWIQEWHSNILVYSAQGGVNDPSLAASRAQGSKGLISLQAVLNAASDNPLIYNQARYLACGALLLAWAVRAVRSRVSQRGTWLALASIAALSMLLVGHHLYDTKLLLLTVPACAMLWAEGGLVGWLALLVNTAGFILTGDLLWAIVFAFINSPHLSATAQSAKILIDVQIFSIPLILLLMGIFYLWLYLRREPERGMP
jgi:hypothetical protein